jgi:hypothetical protein
MGDECVNAPHMDVTQKGEVNEQHQNVIEPIVQRYQTTFQPLIKKHQEQQPNRG